MFQALKLYIIYVSLISRNTVMINWILRMYQFFFFKKKLFLKWITLFIGNLVYFITMCDSKHKITLVFLKKPKTNTQKFHGWSTLFDVKHVTSLDSATRLDNFLRLTRGNTWFGHISTKLRHTWYNVVHIIRYWHASVAHINTWLIPISPR